MKPELKIRAAMAEDALEVRRIYEPFVTSSVTSFEYEVPSVEEMERRITTTLETHPFLVYEDEGERVQGFAYAGPFKSREAYKWVAESSIYLWEECRGKGVGTLMYRELLRVLKEQGFYKVVAGISGTNPASVHFHLKLGFTPVEKWRGIGNKFGEWVDATWYLCELRATTNDLNPTAPVPYKQWRTSNTQKQDY